MKAMVCMSIFLMFFLEGSVDANRHIYVSNVQGENRNTCGGQKNPCNSIQYTIEHIADDRAQIIIDGGQFSKEAYVYYINKTIEITKTIYIQCNPVTRKPILKSDPTGTTEYAFEFNADINNEFHLSSLIFDSIGIAKMQNHIMLKLVGLEMRNNAKKNIDVISYIDQVKSIIELDIQKSTFTYYNHFLRLDSFLSISIKMEDVDIIGLYLNGSFIQDVLHLTSYQPDKTQITFTRCNFMNLASVLLIKIDMSSLDTFYLKYHRRNRFLAMNSTFHNDMDKDTEKRPLKNATVFVQGNINIKLINSHFSGGYGLQAGAIHLLKVSNKITINNCTFVNNTAKWQGGACYFVDNGQIKISNSSFQDNIVLDDSVGNGGAIVNHGSLIVNRCSFINNTAQTFGGTFMHGPHLSNSNKRGTLELLNSKIIGAFKARTMLGDTIYSLSNLIIENMYFKVKNVGSTGASLFHSGVHSVVKIRKNVSYHCPVSQMLYITKQEVLTNESDRVYRHWTYNCESCPNQQYSTNHSYEHIIDQHRNHTVNITCHLRPTGGTVYKTIISNDDFWGYCSKDGTVTFIPCPASYCCSRYGEKCNGYSTCNHNREGLLCSKCQKGYSENFISLQCVDDFTCNKVVFWTFFCIISVLYALFIMYLKNIMLFFKKLASVVFQLETITKYDQEHEGYAPINPTDQASDEGDILMNTRPTVDKSGENDGKISGLIKILFFFYQVEFTIRVNTSTKRTYDHVSFVKEMVSSIFNVNIKFSKYWFLICPYAGMTQIGKIGIKVLFIALLFALITITYAIYKLVRNYNKRNEYTGRSVEQFNSIYEEDIPTYTRPPFQLRLICGIVQLLLLSYSSLAHSAISMITCVKIQDSNHLYVYAELQCYVWWQYLIGVAIVIWILPFSFIIYFSCKLLRYCKITLSQFFLILTFPPVLPYYYIKRAMTKVKPHLTKTHAAYAKQTVMIFEEPFRKKYWESVLLFRRLTIIVICSTISDPLLRLYVVYVPLLLFIVHHIYAWPYKHYILNWLETISLLLICFMGVINLFWSYLFLSNVIITPILNTTGQTFVIIENVVIILPLVSMIILVVLAIGRRIYLLCKRKIGKT